MAFNLFLKKMVNKKAQAAMEFLMTYGWAILIVIIAIAALAYFGVLRSSENVPNNCILAVGLGCQGFRVTSNGVEIEVRNGMGLNLQNFQITLDSPNIPSCNGAVSQISDLNDGEVKKFTILCNVGNIKKFQANLLLSYIPQGYILTHVSQGNLNSKVEPGNIVITSPSAPTITSGPSAISITQNSATINWTTDQASNSSVNYGPIVGNNIEVTSHSIPLTGLIPSKFYSYTVTSCNLTTLNCTSAAGSFTTQSPPIQDAISPLVTLNSPLPFQNISTAQTTFSCITSDNVNVTNVTLWGNWSGSWQYVETRIVGTNISTLTTFTPQSISPCINDCFYGWNCTASDNSSNIGSSNIQLFRVDNTPPIITNVRNGSITIAQVAIWWDTSETANSSIKYGTNLSLSSGTENNPIYVGFRNISIPGLNAGTLYYYTVTSCDSANNCATSGYYNFTTLSSGPTAPVIDSNTTTSTLSSGKVSITWTHTTSGTNRYLLVGISAYTDNAYVKNVTYGGIKLSFIGNVKNSLRHTEIWGLVNPPLGSNTANVTFNDSTIFIVGATSWTGVNQITPIGTFVNNSGNGFIPNIIVTSALGEIVHDVVSWDGWLGTYATIGANQTQYWNNPISGLLGGGGSTEAGASSVNMSWTLSTLRVWAIGAITLKP